MSKEAVGNSWDILYAILGHKYRIIQTGSDQASKPKMCKKRREVLSYNFVSFSGRMHLSVFKYLI